MVRKRKLFQVDKAKRDKSKGRRIGVFRASSPEEAAMLAQSIKGIGDVIVTPTKIIKVKDKRRRLFLFD